MCVLFEGGVSQRRDRPILQNCLSDGQSPCQRILNQVTAENRNTAILAVLAGVRPDRCYDAVELTAAHRRREA